MTTDKMVALKRLVKLMATVDAYPGSRSEVLARLRVDEPTFLRDSEAFGGAFAGLDTHERAELTQLHRLQTAAMKREGARIEDLGPLPVDEIFASRNPPRPFVPAVVTEPMDPVRPESPALPFAGETTPERLAVIRASRPIDEPTGSEFGETALAPRPQVQPPTPWMGTDSGDAAAAGAGTAQPEDETIRARRPGRDGRRS